MSAGKEKLLQIGLDDLGRFAIGEDSKALYFDDAKLQDELPILRDEKLKREIGEIVREVVSARFDSIESQLRQILNRLSSLSRPATKMQKEEFARSAGVRELGELSEQIDKLKQRLGLSKRAKRKQVRRQPSPTK